MATEPSAQPSLDALPTAPSRGDAPTTFRTRADAFVAALITFRTQLVALATWFFDTAGEVFANAGEAATSAGTATTKAGEAAASATSASNAQTAAEAAAAATVWVSGGSYTTGDLHWSPINGATYRALTTHSGETDDPSADPTNWGPILTLSSATDATFFGTTEFSGAFREEVYNLTGLDIDPENGTIQYKVLDDDVTFTESLADGESVLLRLEDGDTYTVTWPTMSWVIGAPTLTANDALVIWKEGSTIYGSYLGGIV